MTQETPTNPGTPNANQAPIGTPAPQPAAPASTPSLTLPAQAGLPEPNGTPANPAQALPATPAPATPPVVPNPDVPVFERTGHAGLDYALDFVSKHGYTNEHPAIQAAREGDFSFIRAELAQKGIQGHEAVVALAERAFEEHTQSLEAQEQETMQYALQVAGGEANWNAVRQWATANAEAHEKQVVNAALTSGGIQAQAMIHWLTAQYSKQNTLEQQPRSAVSPTAAAPASGGTGALTAAAYSQAVQELSRAHGGRDVSGLPEYAALQNRRLAGRRAGI